jgi:hypothetical protein
MFQSCATGEKKPVYFQKLPSFYTLRIFDNKYVFYRADEPVAAWTFLNDGSVVKQGITLSGAVRVYYEPEILFAEIYYSGSVRYGECRYYYPEGGIMYTGYCRDGYLSGKWVSYNFRGSITQTFIMRGTETRMPDDFKLPLDQQIRDDFNAVQMENKYAGAQPVIKPFNKYRAEPQGAQDIFGELPPLRYMLRDPQTGLIVHTMENAPEPQSADKSKTAAQDEQETAVEPAAPENTEQPAADRGKGKKSKSKAGHGKKQLIKNKAVQAAQAAMPAKGKAKHPKKQKAVKPAKTKEKKHSKKKGKKVKSNAVQ